MLDALDKALDAPRGERAAKDAWIRALTLTGAIGKDSARTLPVAIAELAARFGDAPALLSEREGFGFRTLAEHISRYARWALDQDIRPGETVCLMMANRPDYMAIWLGITRVGGVVALLNTNLRGEALAHCIAAVAPRHAIVGAELREAFATALPHLGEPPRAWTVAAPGAFALPEGALDANRYSGTPLTAAEQRPVSLADRALCIYTSGTTGLPKAANVSHRRLMDWAYWFAGLIDVRPDDRMYDCLPMYHSVGGVVATAATLVGGGAVVIAEKFSASRFWDEVVRWDCTLFQYIGELCRYLLAAPPTDAERRHRLRLACGNGLSAEVWEAFEERFAVPQILEFYAATEGSFSLYNVEGRPGAIGRVPPFLAHRFAAAIVRHDEAAGAPLRDADGRCVRCAPGEVGEAIGRLAGGAAGDGGRFEGYTSAAETERKILRDVFAPGDAWFRTGDLMRRDEAGFFYFADRIGDTFRWKGENVATAEVAAAIAACPGIAEAVVYGVAVPGADGRAGMAAIVPGDGFDLATLRARLAGRLPAYARPVFLRLCREIPRTETFKPKKQALAKEGFDPAAVADPLHVDDPVAGAYVPLDAVRFAAIATGAMRL
ncbi:MAG TPA: long-chain-acyl-CoA synthetase [Hyphomicrobiales bacterium]|nr:long-chain-acyl-CoA synthetase [Hyphomicrobiales bacterium]